MIQWILNLTILKTSYACTINGIATQYHDEQNKNENQIKYPNSVGGLVKNKAHVISVYRLICLYIYIIISVCITVSFHWKKEKSSAI